MSNLKNWTVRSDKDNQYTTSISQSGIDLETLAPLPSGNFLPTQVDVTRVTLWATQNLAYDVMFFNNNVGQPNNGDPDKDSMVDWIRFAASDAVQVVAVSGLYRYSTSGLTLKYSPDDRQFHIGLINRGSSVKLPSASGHYVVVEIQGTYERLQ